MCLLIQAFGPSDLTNHHVDVTNSFPWNLMANKTRYGITTCYLYTTLTEISDIVVSIGRFSKGSAMYVTTSLAAEISNYVKSCVIVVEIFLYVTMRSEVPN